MTSAFHLKSFLEGFALSCIFSFTGFFLYRFWQSNQARKLLRVVNAIRARSDYRYELIGGFSPEHRELLEVIRKDLARLQKEQRGSASVRNEIKIILESMVEGVIVVDQRCRVQVINSGAEQIFKISPGRQIGKGLLEVVRNTKIEKIMRQVLAEQIQLSDEITLLQPSEKSLRIRAAGLSTTHEEIRGILIVYDITEIRRLENMRREFVANVSHELKTPLTSIKGFIETLLAGAINHKEKSASFLEMMNEDASRLERLIDDLLDLSKIESRESTLKLERIDLKSEIGRILFTFEPQLQKKNIKTANHIEIPSELNVRADRDQLRQVLINLIDNAIKFNRDGGSIVFDAELLDQNHTVKIKIADTGIGIPKADCIRIFERFYRVDKMRSRELGGTGLGLSIVKHIVELHGGTVSCESESNRGSIFSFTLPTA